MGRQHSCIRKATFWGNNMLSVWLTRELHVDLGYRYNHKGPPNAMWGIIKFWEQKVSVTWVEGALHNWSPKGTRLWQHMSTGLQWEEAGAVVQKRSKEGFIGGGRAKACRCEMNKWDWGWLLHNTLFLLPTCLFVFITLDRMLFTGVPPLLSFLRTVFCVLLILVFLDYHRVGEYSQPLRRICSAPEWMLNTCGR